jgi:hypothetical protein
MGARHAASWPAFKRLTGWGWWMMVLLFILSAPVLVGAGGSRLAETTQARWVSPGGGRPCQVAAGEDRRENRPGPGPWLAWTNGHAAARAAGSRSACCWSGAGRTGTRGGTPT